MFFYDEILQLHINLSPLLISSRVLKAARNTGVQLTWNSKGEICGVSYADKEALSRDLGITNLSVRDFMALVCREPKVASSEFAEWLIDRYTLSETRQCFDSQNKFVEMPISRPAWFRLEDVDDRGLPRRTSSSYSPGLWKFWSPGDIGFTSAAMRSFVTSSGTCSLDLGIPTFAKHPMIMIRECYQAREPEITSPIHSIWNEYECLTQKKDDVAIREFFASLQVKEQDVGSTFNEFVNNKEKEMWYDLAGKKRLLAEDFAGLLKIDESIIGKCLSAEPDESTTFVTGHAHPDADAIVSAIFEAVRRSLLLPPGKTVLPSVECLPREVAHVLGLKIAKLLRIGTNSNNALGPQNEIVLVDTHTIDRSHVHLVRSIIDHHIIKEQFPYYVALSQDVSWSSTLQVYIKILGSGMDLDARAAKILAEATKLEAEPELLHRMSELDRLALKRLETLAGGNTESYADLMRIMTASGDMEEMFYKDYKETTYGFAVVKCKVPQDYNQISRSNNLHRNLPLTIVKQTVYNDEFTFVLSETISMIFNDKFHDKGFTAAVKTIIGEACKAFHGAKLVFISDTVVAVKGVRHQTPRLLLMPLIEDVVKEHLRFVHSKTLGMYVSCGFFNRLTGMYADEREVEVCSQISFKDVKALLASSCNTSFMTLPQYWIAYEEFASRRDEFALKSLRDKTYVELLDTVILNRADVKNGSLKAITVNIMEASPALIRPEDGDQETGIPRKILSPNMYRDPSLWRYWSPDADENVATRGHIFIMDQSCIDLKIGPNERTKNLTFRPIYCDIPDIAYSISPDATRTWIQVVINPRLFSIFDM